MAASGSRSEAAADDSVCRSEADSPSTRSSNGVLRGAPIDPARVYRQMVLSLLDRIL